MQLKKSPAEVTAPLFYGSLQCGPRACLGVRYDGPFSLCWVQVHRTRRAVPHGASMYMCGDVDDKSIRL